MTYKLPVLGTTRISHVTGHTVIWDGEAWKTIMPIDERLSLIEFVIKQDPKLNEIYQHELLLRTIRGDDQDQQPTWREK